MELQNAEVNFSINIVLDYIEMGSLSDIKVETKNAVKTAGTAPEYTLEFWVYLYSYTVPYFGTGSHNVIWDKHTKISITTDLSNNFIAKCYPSVDTSAPVLYPTFSTLKMVNEKWNYLRCSTDQVQKLYSAKNEFDEVALQSFGSHYDFSGDTVGGQAFIHFTQSNVKINWGVIFMAQIRIYNCFKCLQKFDHFVPVTNTEFTSNHVDVINPVYDWKTAGYETRINKIETINPGTTHVATVVNGGDPLVKPGYSYNVIDITKYKRIEDSFCAAGSSACSTIIKINELQNATFTKVPVAYQGRYTIEFWYWVSDIQKFSQGFNIVWKKHVSLSTVQSNENQTVLLLFCFPQDYLVSPYGLFKGNIHNLQKNTENSDLQLRTNTANWIWARCSISGNLNTFYLATDSITNSNKTFKGELIFKDKTAKNKFKYFHDTPTTDVIIDGVSKSQPSNDANALKNIYLYIRSINCYNEYFPPNYTITRHL